MGNGGNAQHADDLFAQAKGAAAAGDFRQMAVTLFASHFPDGLIAQLSKKYPTVPRDEIKECVSKAVAAAYDDLAGGKLILELGAWLRKVAERRAIDVYEAQYRGRTFIDDSDDRIAAPDEEGVRDEARLGARTEALTIARNLLPQLGHDTVIRVMTFLFDAIEDGVEDLPAPEIGKALGLKPDTVRQALSRGFKRLERLAVRYGLNFTAADLTLESRDFEAE